jgi:hypothetical protein
MPVDRMWKASREPRKERKTFPPSGCGVILVVETRRSSLDLLVMKTILAIPLGALLLALPAPAATKRADASLTIRLVSTTGHVTYRDRAPQGPSKGDVISAPSALRNAVKQFGRPKGALVGQDFEVMTLTSATTATMRAKVYLPGGTLRVRGRVSFKTIAGTVQVVGGTGRYANARGTSYVRDLSGNRSLNAYHLRIP